MIDVHCHLTQPDYDRDRDKVIEECKKELKAIITSSPHPRTFKLALEISKEYRGFIFTSLGIHPIYIDKLKQEDIDEAIDFISQNKDSIVAVGEVGLDYYYVKDKELQRKQQELFRRMIKLALKLNLPLVIHTRDTDETIDILEQESAKNVLMHLFTIKSSLPRVIDNGWNISVGPSVMRSKTIRKIARDE